MTNDELEGIFHSALEREPDEREEFVRSETQSDTDVDFILNLLSKADKQTQFMATSYAIEGSPTALDIGEVVGNWLVIELLGRGGMGEVYRVSRIYPDFEQFGALKISRSSQTDLVDRFHNERRILAQLEHPNIGRLIDAGVLRNELPFMVTELVEGVEIIDYVVDNALTVDDSIRLFTQLCEAIAYAHERQILHRDIKPSNVLVNRSGLVKLIDFGVSGFMQTGDVNGGPYTRAFAAPEQERGQVLDESTDIFALGKVLSGLLLETEPDTQWRPERTIALREIEFICRKCTRANPQERYRSVEELLLELQRFTDNKPIQAMEGSWRYVLQKFLHRQRWLVAGVCLVIVSVVSAGFIYLSATNIKIKNEYWFGNSEPIADLPSDRVALGCDQASVQVFSGAVNAMGSITPEQNSIAKLAQDYLNKELRISALSFTPDCQGVALVTESSQYAHSVLGNLPIHYEQTMLRLLREGKKITAVAFDPDRWEQRAAFVIAYEGGYEASPDTSVELIERLRYATEKDGAAAAVVFYPMADRASGWSVLGVNGYQYTRNVYKADREVWYYENLLFLKRNGIVPTFASLSPDGSDYVVGNERCVYSSRPDLVRLEGCPLFTLP